MIQTFDYQGNQLTVAEQEGKFYFCYKDLRKLLGLNEKSLTCAGLDPEDTKLILTPRKTRRSWLSYIDEKPC